MSLAHALRLRDITVRQQLLVEQVRVGQLDTFTIFARELSRDLSESLAHLQYENMSGMTKTELKNFVSALRKSQLNLWNKYVAEMLSNLEDFARVNKRVTARMMASVAIQFANPDNPSGSVTIPNDDEADEMLDEQKSEGFIPLFGWKAMAATEDGEGLLWANVFHAIIPGLGVTIADLLRSTATRSVFDVESVIKRGYANAWTVRETLTALLGSKEFAYKNGLLRTLTNNNASIVATSIQHAYIQTGTAVMSAYGDRYVWLSILDDRTTATCRHLNGRLFMYGKGPLPPAHMRCRSTIELFVGDVPPDDTLYGWSKRQPEKVLQVLFPGALAGRIAAGDAVSAEVSNYKVTQALSIADYENTVGLILTQ